MSPKDLEAKASDPLSDLYNSDLIIDKSGLNDPKNFHVDENLLRYLYSIDDETKPNSKTLETLSIQTH